MEVRYRLQVVSAPMMHFADMSLLIITSSSMLSRPSVSQVRHVIANTKLCLARTVTASYWAAKNTVLVGVSKPALSRPLLGSRSLSLRCVPRNTEQLAMPETRSTQPLVWIDCEMTGLDTGKDTIMSLACFVTDHNLNLLDETGYEAVIEHSKEQMDAMGEWCRDHHGASGLTQACLDSSTIAETAAEELLTYIQKYAPERRRALLAGNTVHADQRFLRLEPWTKVVRYLHHRILDVSAIKEAAKRWAPLEVLKKSPQKAGKHEAKADILESIEEARYYKKMFFEKSED